MGRVSYHRWSIGWSAARAMCSESEGAAAGLPQNPAAARMGERARASANHQPMRLSEKLPTGRDRVRRARMRHAVFLVPNTGAVKGSAPLMSLVPRSVKKVGHGGHKRGL